jgi:hypothetical protein
MANKHMKICPIPLFTKEIQIKSKMRYHCTPIRMDKNFLMLKIQSGGENVEQLKLSCLDSGSTKW